jgi:hypothetical protein
MNQRPIPSGEKPKAEPEILPPGETDLRWDGASGWSAHGAQRVYVARIGPFGIVLIAIAVAAIALVILVLVLGAFLLWIPVAGLLLAIAVISGMWRGRRLR